jgi:hypothetical protein
LYNITEDGEVVAKFETLCGAFSFLERQKRIFRIKKEIERVERNKLSEFLRNVNPESKQHREFLIVWFQARMPKWKRIILDLYVYEGKMEWEM